MLRHKEIIISLLLYPLLLSGQAQQSDYGGSSIFYKHGNEITVFTKSTLSDTSVKILCSDHSEKPRLSRAWYGLSGSGNNGLGGGRMITRCTDVTAEESVRWTDLTEAVQKNCLRSDNGPGCALPTISHMQKKSWIREEDAAEAKYWLVCYSCNNSISDSSVQEWRQQSRSSPYLSRKELAQRMLDRALLSMGRGMFFGAAGRSAGNSVEDVEDFLRKAEETAGKLTNLLREEETMNLVLDSIGDFTILRRRGGGGNERSGNGHNIWNGGNNLILPDQDAIRNEEDRSLVAAVIQYDPRISDLFNRSMSGLLSVTAFNSTGGWSTSSRSLSHELLFNLTHPAVVTPDSAPVCAFWDFSLSAWSTDGCSVVESRNTSTLCSCSHLTNFAVLLDLVPADEASALDDPLRVITIVGCSLSVLGLIGSLAFFLQHRGNDLTDRVRITAHFCACLLVVQLLMIFGVDQADIPTLCRAVGVLLHYSLLATFCWSLLSGHQIYVMLVQVFDSEGQQRMKWYYGIGYGVPAGLVVASLAADAIWYDGRTYGGEDHCWMDVNEIYYACFLFPLFAILIVNLSMLALVIVKVFRIKPRPHMFGQARGWFSLALLLGVTWAVGVAAKAFPRTAAMAYIFTVLNSLQGVLIFVFHVLLGQRCRTKMRRRGLRSSTDAQQSKTSASAGPTSS